MALKLKKNYLLKRISEILSSEKRGCVLDLGCGKGHYCIELKKLGFDVTPSDFGEDEFFQFHDQFKFVPCDLTKPLPFAENTFDYVLFLEVIEHLEQPFDAIEKIGRILKPGGALILSTPNILNLGSRMRFLLEGSWDFFREPILDYHKKYLKEFPDKARNLHIIPWRYHELEYMLYQKNFQVTSIYTDFFKRSLKLPYYLIYPLLKWHNTIKVKRSLKKDGIDYNRINKIFFSPEIQFGKHLILKAQKV